MTFGDNSREQIKSIVERIVRLEEEKRTFADDINGIYAEAKSNGFDAAALRIVVKEKMADKAKRDKAAEREAIADTYRVALGLLSDLPLGQSAIERATS